MANSESVLDDALSSGASVGGIASDVGWNASCLSSNRDALVDGARIG